MGQRLTDRAVKALPAAPKGNRITYDNDVTGFGVRVTAAGKKAFVLNYRVNGRERRYTIGRCNNWSVTAAREEAKRLKRAVDTGIDPLGEQEAARDAATVANLCDDYLDRHAIKKRTEREDRRKIEHTIRPKLGRRRVGEVTSRDIEDLHWAMKETPYEANRTLALLSKMFSLAVKWQWRPDNPCRGVERFDEEKRQRYLTDDELARLVAVLDQTPYQTTASVVRLLLLTGARKGEVLNATWDQFDLGAGVWVKPSAHTKAKREHRVPLSAPAVDLLARLEKQAAARDDDLVFPGKAPGVPLKDVKRGWRAICDAADLKGLRVHDLRHSYASILVSRGFSLPIIGGLLGHTQPSTTARYAHLTDTAMREATGRVGAVVQDAGKPAEAGKVVELRK